MKRKKLHTWPDYDETGEGPNMENGATIIGAEHPLLVTCLDVTLETLKEDDPALIRSNTERNAAIHVRITDNKSRSYICTIQPEDNNE